MGKTGRGSPKVQTGAPAGLSNGEGTREKGRCQNSTHLCVEKKGVKNHMAGYETPKSHCAPEGWATSLGPLPAVGGGGETMIARI